MSKQEIVREAEVVEPKELAMTGENHQAMSVMKPAEMKKQMREESKKREILTEYITNHFKDGIDYGKIHVMPKSKCDKGNRCTNQYHYSKATLFKAGAEKFLSLFRLRVEYRKDSDTWEMLNNAGNCVCYLAELYTANGTLVGEGRGVCTVDEKGSANTAVKIAQKRAKIDAVLSSGGLSDFFTQDLDEESYKEGGLDAPKKTTPPKKLEDIIKDSIAKSRTIDTLIKIDEGIKSSEKLTDAAKKRLAKLVASRSAELDDVDQSKG